MMQWCLLIFSMIIMSVLTIKTTLLMSSLKDLVKAHTAKVKHELEKEKEWQTQESLAGASIMDMR